MKKIPKMEDICVLSLPTLDFQMPITFLQVDKNTKCGYSQISLSLCILMDSPFWFDAINLG